MSSRSRGTLLVILVRARPGLDRGAGVQKVFGGTTVGWIPAFAGMTLWGR